MRLRLLCLFLALSASAWGQGSVSTGTPITFDQSGHVLQNASVAVCTKYPGAVPAPPCGEAGNSLATIYTDISLLTPCSGSAGLPLNNVTAPGVGAGCANPGSPSSGNVVAYTSPGLYWIEYYGSGIATQVSPVIFPASFTPPIVFGTGAPNGPPALTPLTFSVLNGTSSAYITNSAANSPYAYTSLWQATPQAGAGFAWYNTRLDTQTKPATDVAAGVTLGVFNSSKSTNLVGGCSPNCTGTDNNTNQVAFVANSTALDTAGNANPIAATFIAGSLYTGSATHTVEGVQTLVSGARAPGWFADATHDYIVGHAILLNAGASFNGTVGLAIDSSTSGKGFLFGRYVAGAAQVGDAILNGPGSVIPTADYWASNASGYGLFCGAGITGVLFPTNTGDAPVFGSNPPNCVAAGPSAATSGTSSNIRWISTSAGGAEQDWDSLHTPDGILHFKFGGVDKFTFDNNGNGVLTGASTATKFCMSTNLCWTSGAGVPSGGSCTAANGGSLYSRTDGNTTTTLYVCDNATHVWTAK